MNSFQTLELCTELESLLGHYNQFDGRKVSLEDHMDRVENSLSKFSICGDEKSLADQITSLKVRLRIISAWSTCHVAVTFGCAFQSTLHIIIYLIMWRCSCVMLKSLFQNLHFLRIIALRSHMQFVHSCHSVSRFLGGCFSKVCDNSGSVSY